MYEVIYNGKIMAVCETYEQAEVVAKSYDSFATIQAINKCEHINKDAPVICAECKHFAKVNQYPQECEKTGKKIYNSRPKWCPYPLWVREDENES